MSVRVRSRVYAQEQIERERDVGDVESERERKAQQPRLMATVEQPTEGEKEGEREEEGEKSRPTNVPELRSLSFSVCLRPSLFFFVLLCSYFLFFSVLLCGAFYLICLDSPVN